MATSAESKKNEIQDIMLKLEQGVKEVFESNNYQNYLIVMSRFHRYSVNNQLLIMLQRPDAQLVAGYNAWLKNKRQVMKGEKSIRILAPQKFTVKQEKDVTVLDSNGFIVLDNNGAPITEKNLVEDKYIKFVPVSVFDVSQTSGEPLPNLKKVSELDGAVSEREVILNALRDIAGIPIEIIPISDGSKGYFSHSKQRIAIKADMSDMQTIKTGIHEVAHKLLHDPANVDILAATNSRSMKEVQAESVAYIVSNHFELDTSDYSFGYIASWSSGKQLNELKASLNEIQKAAEIVIDGIEKVLNIDKSITQDSSINATASTAAEISAVPTNIHPSKVIPNEINEKISFLYDRTIESLQRLVASYNDSVETGEPLNHKEFKSELEHISNLINVHTDGDEAQISGKLLNVQDSINNIIKNMGLNGIDVCNAVELVEGIYNKPPLLERPVVTIEWSEHKAFKDDEKYSLAIIDDKFARYDREVVRLKEEAKAKDDYYPYFKTKFRIDFPMNGQNHTYTGRQDIGDGDGGLISHIKDHASYSLKPENAHFIQTDEHRKDLEWIVKTFIPYLDNAKEIEVNEFKLKQLQESSDLLVADTADNKKEKPKGVASKAAAAKNKATKQGDKTTKSKKKEREVL